MLPAGYLLKRITPPSGWHRGEPNRIPNVCSVADCVNDDVVDVRATWQHNSFGLANTPDTLRTLASEAEIDKAGAILFYYTAYEYELPSDGWTFDPSRWQARSPDPSSSVSDCVEIPPQGSTTLLGHDVVVFGYSLEHSPLSCNAIAFKLPVNEHCLFNSVEEALAAVNSGAFGGGCEAGRYTIFSVHRVGLSNGN